MDGLWANSSNGAEFFLAVNTSHATVAANSAMAAGILCAGDREEKPQAQGKRTTAMRFRRRLLFWAPRALGLAFSLLLAVFALDAFSDGQPLFDAVLEFLIHLLPSLVVATVVAVSWRREWIGAVTFAALSLAYAGTTARGHFDWMLIVSGPLLLVSMLFLWNWLNQRRQVLGG